MTKSIMLALGVFLVLLICAPASHGHDVVDHSNVHKEPKLLTNIDVGTKRPENCVRGEGANLYVSQAFFGGVISVNLITGQATTVVPNYGYFARLAGGLIPVDGYLFVAGGGARFGVKPKFHVYNIKTGNEVVTCSPPYNVSTSFLNDVAVIGGKAYFTDTQYNALVVADIEAAKKGQCVLSSIPLPPAFYDPTGIKGMADGIVAFQGGLIITNVNDGGLFYVDVKTQTTTQIASSADAPGTDGLRLAGNLLYATEVFNNRIAVWKLNMNAGGNVTAIKQGYLTSAYYDTPTGVAIYKQWAYACNFRAASLGPIAPGEGYSNFTQHFNLVGLDRFSYA